MQKIMDMSARILSQSPVKPHLQAEAHPADAPRFTAKYRELTGGKGPSVFSRSQRGVAVAVYFNGTEVMAKNIEMLGYEVKRFQHGAWQFCVESEEFFWKMIRNGFRL